MKSFFKELEINLYNIINDSPLSIEAKYYIMQSVFRQVSDAYLEFLNMPEQEEKIKNDIEDDLDTNSDEDVEVERVENEDGTFTIKTKGKDVSKVISQTFNELKQEKGEE